jgi:prepilin-type N-terminal cleavage/methylation domain-containing protein
VSAHREGFTLIETLMALALAGLLVFGAVDATRRLGPKLDLQAGIWGISTGLTQARFRAIMSGAAVRVRFVPSGFVFERYDTDSASWRPARAVGLPGVRIGANNAPVFYPQGTVSDLASISVGNASGAYKITVAITGRIKAVRTR